MLSENGSGFFCVTGMEEKASIATHSTAEQAGEFARAIKARNLVLTHFSARYEQIDKFGKVWTAAKERGMSVGELQASVTSGLQEEAKMAAGKARVYLANDFYTFTVAPRAPVPVGQLEHAAQSQQKGREDDGVWRPGVRPVALASRQQMAYPAQRGAGYSGQQGSGQPMPRHMDRGQQGGYSGHRGRGAYAGSRGGRRPDK